MCFLHSSLSLVVPATDHIAASIFRAVSGTIRLVFAAAQAVDTFVWFNELDKERPIQAFSTTGRTGIILSTIIITMEIVRANVKAACHLDISMGLAVVVGRLDKAMREDLDTGNNGDVTCAERNGAVFVLGDTTTWKGRQEEAEFDDGSDAYSLGCRHT